MFFANDQRDTVREENPGISFGQVGKVLGDKWKALSEKQRIPYESKAAADKKRYEEEKAKYNVSFRKAIDPWSQANVNRRPPKRRRMALTRRSPPLLVRIQYTFDLDDDTQ